MVAAVGVVSSVVAARACVCVCVCGGFLDRAREAARDRATHGIVCALSSARRVVVVVVSAVVVAAVACVVTACVRVCMCVRVCVCACVCCNDPVKQRVIALRIASLALGRRRGVWRRWWRCVWRWRVCVCVCARACVCVCAHRSIT